MTCEGSPAPSKNGTVSSSSSAWRRNPNSGAYRTGMRRAVAIACLGTIHTDRVDLWIDGLLDNEQEEAG